MMEATSGAFLEEFAAHSGGVRCIHIGRKSYQAQSTSAHPLLVLSFILTPDSSMHSLLRPVAMIVRYVRELKSSRSTNDHEIFEIQMQIVVVLRYTI